jgi:predicted DNA-binding transcriptional regulator YafY
MRSTATRLLRLLTLLQVRREWTGTELSSRLEVDVRTIRRDIVRLRELGYPVQSFSGTGGAYLLGAGSKLPPLVLDDDEAIAVAASLLSTTEGGETGIEEPALRAYVKLISVLPARLQTRLRALRAATVLLARSDAEHVDGTSLSVLAVAVRDGTVVEFEHQGRDGLPQRRSVEPHRLVSAGRRWYLLAWDTTRADWRTFRLDRVRRVAATQIHFTPRQPPHDAAALVSRSVASSPYRFQARLRMHASAEAVRAKMSALAGDVEPLGDGSCVLHTGSDSLEVLAFHVLSKGFAFDVLEPPELRVHFAQLAKRCSHAAVEP